MDDFTYIATCFVKFQFENSFWHVQKEFKVFSINIVFDLLVLNINIIYFVLIVLINKYYLLKLYLSFWWYCLLCWKNAVKRTGVVFKILSNFILRKPYQNCLSVPEIIPFLKFYEKNLDFPGSRNIRFLYLQKLTTKNLESV